MTAVKFLFGGVALGVLLGVGYALAAELLERIATRGEDHGHECDPWCEVCA